MIAMSEQDRDVLRFLWVDDVSKTTPTTVVLRFTRVVFGISSSPFLLNATIRHHLEKYVEVYPDLVNKLLGATYVDDVITGAESEEAAHELCLKARELLKHAGFILRKFTSNSALLRDKLKPEELTTPDNEETYSRATLGGSQKLYSGEQKVLGIKWNTFTDQFVINLQDITDLARSLEPTKRNIVSLVGKFYDPLGFLAPVVVQFKMFLQLMCESKMEWDQLITEELLWKW